MPRREKEGQMMFKTSSVWVFAALTMAATQAFAAIPVEVTTAFSDLNADLIVVGGLIVVATLGVAVWKYVQALII